MTIRNLKYLALLGGTTSLLNWSVAYGADEPDAPAASNPRNQVLQQIQAGVNLIPNDQQAALAPAPAQALSSHEQRNALIAQHAASRPVFTDAENAELTLIHVALDDEKDPFIPTFVTMRKEKIKEARNWGGAAAHQVIAARRSIMGAMGGSDDDDWGDDGNLDSLTSSQLGEAPKLTPNLEYLLSFTQVYREAIKSHNAGQQDNSQKIAEMPESGWHKNEMLLWEWKYYNAAGQKKRLNEIVRAYIIREQASLKLKYGNLNPDDATVNYKTSRLAVTNPLSAMMMSVCFPGSD